MKKLSAIPKSSLFWHSADKYSPFFLRRLNVVPEGSLLDTSKF